VLSLWKNSPFVDGQDILSSKMFVELSAIKSIGTQKDLLKPSFVVLRMIPREVFLLHVITGMLIFSYRRVC